MSSITADNGHLVLNCRYDAGLVAELKNRIPPQDRQWDGARKIWQIAPAHGALLVELVQRYWGETLPMPTLNNTAQPETRLLDVRYIGQTKERGGAGRTAYGWCANRWSVIFPEAALRAWFAAPAQPTEAATLYQTLSIAGGADAGTIKAAYRRLARQWHPDVCREPDATRVFQALQHAYEILSDPETRRRYDAGLQLAATLSRQTRPVTLDLSLGYRSPLRCGYILADGQAQLGRFVVTAIQMWEDIVDAAGRTLSTSWPLGAERPVEVWL